MRNNTNLNWSSLEELRADSSLLSSDQENRVAYVEEELSRKNRVDESKCLYGSYYSNASIIAMSNWDRAKSYIMCGMYVDGKRKYCQDHRYCERCAYERSKRIYNKYIASWRARDVYWYHITYAFKNNVDLRTTNQEAYLSRWKEADAFFRALNKNGTICGAVVVNELSVAGLAEQQVFPHTHAVVISYDDNLQEDEVFQTMGLNVDIDVRPIDNERYMLNCLKYPIKAINLKKTYEEELPTYDESDINLGVEILLGRTTAFEKGWKKIKYIGRMNAMNPMYVGTNPAKRKRKTNRKRLNRKKTSSTIRPMDQNPNLAALRHMMAKEAQPLPAPVAPMQPKPKKPGINPLLAGGLVAGGLYGADRLFNGGQATSSVMDWVKNKFNGSPTASTIVRPPIPAKDPNTLRSLDYLSGVQGAATTYPGSDSLPNTPVQAGISSAVDSTLPAGMGLEGAAFPYMLASGAIKRFPSLARGAGASAINNISSTAGKVMAPLSVVNGAMAGHSMGHSPLLEEAWSNPTKRWWNPASWGMNAGETRDPAAVRHTLKPLATALGGAAGAAPFVAGGPVGAVAGAVPYAVNNFMNHWETSNREDAAQAEYTGSIKDHLLGLYRDGKDGDNSNRAALQEYLNQLKSNPAEFNSLRNDPIVSNLVNRSNQVLGQTH